MLEDVFESANAATEVTLFQNVCEEAVAAEGVAALQSNRLHKHLKTK